MEVVLFMLIFCGGPLALITFGYWLGRSQPLREIGEYRAWRQQRRQHGTAAPHNGSIQYYDEAEEMYG